MIFMRHAHQKFEPANPNYQDNGLTALGIEQANKSALALKLKYGDRLKKGGFIYSSPLVRGKETAEILKTVLGGEWVHYIDARLTERCYHDDDTPKNLIIRANAFYHFIVDSPTDVPVIVICHGQWYRRLAALHNFSTRRLAHAEFTDFTQFFLRPKL